MTWLAWRVQRLHVLVAVGAVAAFVVWLLVTGLQQQSAFNATHGCGLLVAGQCGVLLNNLGKLNSLNNVNRVILLFVPSVFGMIVGVPVVAREIERRTNRLVWTQAITRSRWLDVKMVIAGAIAAATVGGLCIFLGWWVAAINRTSLFPSDRMVPQQFDISGVAPLAYALFAFAAAVALGAVIKRPGWALAASAPLVAAVRILLGKVLRNDLLPPVVLQTRAGGVYPPKGLILESGYVPLGRTTPGAGQNWGTGWAAMGNCEKNPKPLGNALNLHCQAVTHLHWVVVYQPDSHFWPLQLVELGIYLALTVIAVAVALSAVRRWQA